VTTRSVESPVGVPIELPPPARRSLLGDALRELRELSRYRSLFRHLVWSSLRTENAGTVFGFLWWILDPLLLMLTYYVLVAVVFDRGGPDFLIFLLTGIVAWQLFSKASQRAVANTIKKERSIQQVDFPKSVLPLASVAGETIKFGFAFLVLLVVAIPFGILPSAYALLAVPIVAIQLVFTLGVAFFLSALNFFLRDTTKLLDYTFRIWFFLSPTLYAVSAVPERFRSIYELNPFATLLPAFRAVVMEHTFPDLAALGYVAAVSAVALVGGFLFFVRAQPWFAKLV
jgi:lipopolysaccharide transport system permease protein